MIQEDKDLLLKDLCARISYGVMVREDTVLYDDKNTTSHRIKKLSYVQIGKGFSRIKGFIHDYEYIYIPYLFPLTNMTEEQKMEIKSLCDGTEIFDDGGWMSYISIVGSFNFELNLSVVDWLNKNHFDYIGLIPKGLAIDATGLNIY
jgi:hypothetical protein